MTIPDEIIEQIRQYTDIVDIIGEVVDLKRRGTNFIGKCPFHNEKTPSFTVSQDKHIYKCFGCGKSGNVFTFMMEYHGLSFVDSVRDLAKKSGISIPEEPKSQKAKEQLSRTEIALKALEAAAAQYIKLLSTKEGKAADTYFNKRAFSRELIKEFGLGFSNEAWDTLSRELKRQGFPDSALHDAGLVVDNDKGGFYDRFRGRVIFPIHNFMGKVIGFGARILIDDPAQPKYINSPQTIVYDKSRTLYGLHQAKNEIRNKRAAILVEGYADVLTLHQAGYKNTVASSGTSLTKEQLEILGKYCKKIFMVYDADSAGVKATERGLEIALEQGFDVNIVQLPSGEDPDSLVRVHGSSIFQVYLNGAVSFIDFKVMLLKKQGGLDTPSGKAEAVRSIIKLITKIPDRLQHNDFISHLAALLKISEYDLHKVYEEKASQEKSASSHLTHTAAAAGQRAAQNRLPAASESQSAAQAAGGKAKSQAESNSGAGKFQILPEESLLLQLSLTSPGAMAIITEKFNIEPGHFQTDEGRRLFALLLSLSKENVDIMTSIFSSETIEESDKNFFTTLVFRETKPSENWHKFARVLPDVDVSRLIQDALYKLELYAIDRAIPEIQSNLRTAPFEEQKPLLERIKFLSDRRTYIFNEINS